MRVNNCRFLYEIINFHSMGNSLSDPGTSNLIPFPGAKCLALSEGKLYVGTARSLYRFIPISVDDQVEVDIQILLK